MLRNFVAIINPISGGLSKKHIPKLLQQYLHQVNLSIHYSTSGEHLINLAQQAINNKVDAVIAVGGDGTINQIATQLINTKIPLGIVPMGSGNGFANELNISKNVVEAIKTINLFFVEPIDTGMVNEKTFLNVTGSGFDAQIGYLFNRASSRGLITYTKIVLQEIFTYKTKPVKITVNNQTISYPNCFLATVGNGKQFGNNVFICPQANIKDGLLNLTVVKKLNFIDALLFGTAVLTKNFNKCKRFVDFYLAENFIIERENKQPVNIDGEAEVMAEQLTIQVVKNSLHVIVNKNHE